jgi:hypothetical protein
LKKATNTMIQSMKKSGTLLSKKEQQSIGGGIFNYDCLCGICIRIYPNYDDGDFYYNCYSPCVSGYGFYCNIP